MSSGNISVLSVRSRLYYPPPRLNIRSIALQSFEEWNPELANRARDMYGDINNLELYVWTIFAQFSLTKVLKPGLLCECSDGSGFRFGYTLV